LNYNIKKNKDAVMAVLFNKKMYQSLFLSIIFIICHSSVFSQSNPIIVGTQNVSAIGLPAKNHAKTWEHKTQIPVVVLQTDFGELFQEFIKSLTDEKAKYDVLLFPSAWMGDFYPYLATLPEDLSDNDAFDDIHPIYRERLMSWDGKLRSITIDGDLFSGYYRKDLFQDIKHQKAFQSQYGYELLPPNSWKEYRDIAEYFTGKVSSDGIKLYGASEPFVRGGQQFWDLFSRAASYTNHPNHPGAQFFDPDTMRAEINNPGWIQAVKDYKEILKYCPPEAIDFGIVEARKAFIKGQTALLLDWGDSAQLSADTTQSRIVGKVGFFELPGSTKVWNGRMWQWQDFPEIHKVPFLAFGGWIAGVANNSKQQEKAWDYIMWLSNPQNSLQDVVTSGTGINPYRFTHFSNIDAWTQSLSKTSASEYLNILMSSLDSPNAALDLRLPGFYRYTEALEKQLTLILQGKLEEKKGMDKVFKAWEKITESLGRQNQLEIYRTSMGLSKNISKFKPIAINKEKYLIGFSQATTTEPWRLLFNKELRFEADQHSEIKLLVRDAQDSVHKQQADVNYFIQQKVDAILISPKVADELTPIVSKAFDQNIPVFVLDRDVQYIGGDNIEIGRAAGRYTVELLGGEGKAKGNIIEIWGGMASTPAQDRHNGFVEIISQESEIRILNTPTDGDWKQDLGYEIMIDVLEKFNDIDVVYAHNDPMAYGAYLAAKDSNKNENIRFLGIDGIPEEGVKWVSKGILDATFLYKTPGDEGIRQALSFLKGNRIKKRITLPTKVIDKSNAYEILQK